MPRRNRVGRRYKVGNDPVKKIHSSWVRGKSRNFIPSKTNLLEEGAIEKYILHGWVPPEPVILSGNQLIAMGSCFAQHITRHLRLLTDLTLNPKAKANLFAFGAGFVNTFTIRQHFEWMVGRIDLDGTNFSAGFKNKVENPFDEESRQVSRDILERTDAFILTLGLSEIWHDKLTDKVFFRATAPAAFNPRRHGCRVTTVDENLDNLRATYRVIRELHPRAPIIFTLSPVPLIATFRPVSCITANTVSKAILRVAVDMLMRELQPTDPMLFYWPSYEIITEFFGQRGFRVDRRHVTEEALTTIMQLFTRYFVDPQALTVKK